MVGKYLPANYRATLIADDYTTGSYSLFNVEPSGYTEVSAGSTVTLGPFDVEKYYNVNDLSFSISPYTIQEISDSIDVLQNNSLLLDASNAFSETGNLVLFKANASEDSNAVEADGNAGVITTSSLSVAAGSSYVITWTNSLISTSSVIGLCLQGGTNTTTSIQFSCVPADGSATITIYNNDPLSPLNGTLVFGYMVF